MIIKINNWLYYDIRSRFVSGGTISEDCNTGGESPMGNSSEGQIFVYQISRTQLFGHACSNPPNLSAY